MALVLRAASSKLKMSERSDRAERFEIKSQFKKNIKEISELQKITIQISKLFLKDINMAIKNPDLSWQEWLTEEKIAN